MEDGRSDNGWVALPCSVHNDDLHEQEQLGLLAGRQYLFDFFAPLSQS